MKSTKGFIEIGLLAFYVFAGLLGTAAVKSDSGKAYTAEQPQAVAQAK